MQTPSTITMMHILSNPRFSLLLLACLMSQFVTDAFSGEVMINRAQKHVSFSSTGTGRPSEGDSTRILRKETCLFQQKSDSDVEKAEGLYTINGPEAQFMMGGKGIVASLIVLYSETVLKTTGCGLPAGPGGLVGAVEGISYSAVVFIAGYSLFTNSKPFDQFVGDRIQKLSGSEKYLVAAEALSYLAIVYGLVVLALQIVNYGYIPNAVPMEGGMCQ